MTKEPEHGSTLVMLGVVLGIVVMVGLVNIVPSVLSSSDDVPNVLTKYGDTIGAFLGAAAAILFALWTTSRSEMRKRKGIVTAIKAEVLTNRATIQSFLGSPWELPAFRFDLVDNAFHYADAVSPEVLVAVTEFRLQLRVLESGNGVMDKAYAENRELYKRIYGFINAGQSLGGELDDLKQLRADASEMTKLKAKELEKKFAEMTHLLEVLDSEGASLDFRERPPYSADP
jgi:hypothetical protein